MQQRREPDTCRLPGGAIDRPERVVPEVLAFDLVLRHAHVARRDPGRSRPAGPSSAISRRPIDGRSAARSRRHLHRDALARQVPDELLAFSLIAGPAWPIRSAKSSVAASRTARTIEDGILIEPLGGVADGPQRSSRQVGLAAVRVDEPRRLPGLGAPGHRVDREVAPRQFELYRLAELDPCAGGSLRSRGRCGGRDLDFTDIGIAGADRDRPELVLVDGAREQLHGPFRKRRRREVPVLRPAAEHRVTQRPADDVRGMTAVPEGTQQAVNDVLDGGLELGRHVARWGLSRDRGTGTSASRFAVVREVRREQRVEVAAWLVRLAGQPKTGLLERLATLSVVARLARGDQVLPAVRPAPMARRHVVEREVVRLAAAVLARVPVARTPRDG